MCLQFGNSLGWLLRSSLTFLKVAAMQPEATDLPGGQARIRWFLIILAEVDSLLLLLFLAGQLAHRGERGVAQLSWRTAARGDGHLLLSASDRGKLPSRGYFPTSHCVWSLSSLAGPCGAMWGIGGGKEGRVHPAMRQG